MLLLFLLSGQLIWIFISKSDFNMAAMMISINSSVYLNIMHRSFFSSKSCQVKIRWVVPTYCCCCAAVDSDGCKKSLQIDSLNMTNEDSTGESHKKLCKSGCLHIPSSTFLDGRHSREKDIQQKFQGFCIIWKELSMDSWNYFSVFYGHLSLLSLWSYFPDLKL